MAKKTFNEATPEDVQMGNVENSMPELRNAEPEQNESEAAPAATGKMRSLISGAEFWKFAPEKDGEPFDGSVFEGYYMNEVKREKPGKDSEKQPAGSVIGYLFRQKETETEFIIGKSHAVEKAIAAAQYNKEKYFRFEFLGKGKTADNQPYNRYDISIED
jgi:hypothetical protein